MISIFLLSIIVSVAYAVFGNIFDFDIKTFSRADLTRQGGLTDTMRFGYGIAMVLPVLITLLLRCEETKRWINIRLLKIAIIAGFAGLFLTQTRGAILACLLATACTFFIFDSRRFKYFIIVLLVISSAYISVCLIGIENFNMNSSNRIFADIKQDERITIFHAALLSIKERPVSGLGVRQFGERYVEIKRRYNLQDPEKDQTHAHNILLEIGASVGIIGIILLALWLGLWAREMFVAGGVTCAIGIPFCVALFVGGQFEYIFDANNSFLIFAMYAGTIGMAKVNLSPIADLDC